MSLIEQGTGFAVGVFGANFTVYGQPEQGGSKTQGRRKNGTIFYRDDNPRVYGWKERVMEVAGTLMKGREPFAGPLALEVTFYRERPKWHLGAKGLRPKAPRYPIVKPDTTKLLRPFEDALNGIVYVDDSQIVDQVVRKRYGTPARAEVRVTVLV